MSEIVNSMASKIQREIKETLQWPPMEKSIQWCYLDLPMHSGISRELETLEFD